MPESPQSTMHSAPGIFTSILLAFSAIAHGVIVRDSMDGAPLEARQELGITKALRLPLTSEDTCPLQHGTVTYCSAAKTCTDVMFQNNQCITAQSDVSNVSSTPRSEQRNYTSTLILVPLYFNYVQRIKILCVLYSDETCGAVIGVHPGGGTLPQTDVKSFRCVAYDTCG
ncbi:hypothetical protein C8J57DRAFT_521529 [Mycena rebaudengoi]|nr:hypothetical protein C8J57DRAFT_521529 [Mycena rebaudengoi]